MKNLLVLAEAIKEFFRRYVFRKAENASQPIHTPTTRFPAPDSKIELIRHGVMQKDIAAKLGCDHAVISRLVTGQIPKSRAQRISDFLEHILDDMQSGTFKSLDDYEA